MKTFLFSIGESQHIGLKWSKVNHTNGIPAVLGEKQAGLSKAKKPQLITKGLDILHRFFGFHRSEGYTPHKSQ